MKPIFLTLLTFLVSAGYTFAGTDVGNGGKGIVCKDKKEVISYDLERARKEWKFVTRPLNGAGSAKLIAASIIEPLKELDPIRHKQYYDRIGTFMDDLREFEDYEFDYIHDTSDIGVPEGCEIQVVINQKKKTRPEDKKFRLNVKLWDRMKPLDKAALIVHEIFLEEMLKDKVTGADGAMYMTGYLSSTAILTHDRTSYIGRLENESEGKLFYYDKKHKSWFSVGRLELYPSGEVKKGYLHKESSIDIGTQKLKATTLQQFGWTYNDGRKLCELPIEYFENGSVKQAMLTQDQPLITYKRKRRKKAKKLSTQIITTFKTVVTRKSPEDEFEILHIDVYYLNLPIMDCRVLR